VPDIKGLIDRFDKLESERGTWEIHWEEIAERVLPRHMGFVGERTKGEKKTQKVFDSRPMIALDRFAAVMDSMLTPRQSEWHGLRATIDSLNEDREVRDWFYQVNKILRGARYSPKANFSGQNSERWISMGAFGTGVLFIDFEPGVGLRYKSVNLKDVFLMENHQGMVDTVFRRFEYTARQAAQRWGADNLPEKIAKALKDPKKIDKEFPFIHIVKPRLDFDDSREDVRGKPWESVYISKDDKEQVGENSGYGTFPYSISRYVTAPDEVYGRGPAMMALPDIKMLNEMSKTDIRAVHKLIDPPLLLHDDGIMGNGGMSVNLTPGGLNFGGVNRDGRQLIQPLQTGARVDINEQKMEQRRGSIDNAFLVTLFQILVETPRMTATEALIRSQEKGMLLTPTMGRQQSEALGPQIEREIDLLMQHNVLPPLPQALIEAEGQYEITYESPMSRMQRAEELVGVQRTMELLTPFAQFNPDVMDIFDPDALAQLTAEVSGVPMPVLRQADEIASIRQNRARQQQTADLVSAAKPVAGAIKDIAQAQSLGQAKA